MVACYILKPIAPQISVLAHSLSHELAKPEFLLHHSEKSPVAHSHEDHSFDNMEHEHAVIDFFEQIIEESHNSEHNDDPLQSDTKIDKHLANWAHPKTTVLSTVGRPVHMGMQRDIADGFEPRLLRPPIDFSTHTS